MLVHLPRDTSPGLTFDPWLLQVPQTRPPPALLCCQSRRQEKHLEKTQSQQLPIKATHPAVISPSVEVLGKAPFWADAAQQEVAT